MSKVGKKPVILLEGVSIKNVGDGEYEIKGPKGILFFKTHPDFSLTIEDKILKIVPKSNLNKKTKALWGTLRATLQNKVLGVSQGFEKVLILEGLGYGGEVKGNKIVFKLGFSHPVELNIPEGIQVEIKAEKGRNLVYVRGIDKEKVGEFASKIKKLKPADRYHLKGFRYIDEVIKTKPVKKAVK